MVDFYLVKGIVERIADQLALRFEYETTQIDGLHPGRTAAVTLNGEAIGFIGELHPTVAKTYDLGRTYVFELNYEKSCNSQSVILTINRFRNFRA